jgi:hypothetical protein
MSNLTPRIDRIERTAYGSEIEVGKISAPFTTIKNEQGQPRQISDLANNMKVSMGVERIHTKSISVVANEFGPNGEVVWKSSQGDERIRFIGDWEQASSALGSRPFSDVVGSSLEVTFYGTGLNLLSLTDVNVRNFDVYVDNDTAFLLSFDGSSVLNNRNYEPNNVVKVINNLPLGIHTVRLERLAGAGFAQNFGFEILNESTQLVVNPGKPRFDSKNLEIPSQILTDYNTGFDALSDTLGTKGGRVLVYQAADGSINKRLTATDPQVTIGDPTNLVTNGTFDTDISGWTRTGTAPGVTEFSSNHGGSLRHSDTGTGYAQANTTITTVIGQRYKLSYDLKSFAGTGTNVFQSTYISDANDPLNVNGFGPAFASVASNVVGPVEVEFTAVSTSTRIQFSEAWTSANTTDFEIDNVSVVEVSYNFLALGDTDHSQEEIIRRINFREFGANRADDFSTLSSTSSDRAFTLDDGTTTLVGDDVDVTTAYGGECLVANASADFWTLTFVGTGLDLYAANDGNGRACQVYIDGANVGILDPGAALNGSSTLRVCSGLPYGTHTVKVERDGGTNSWGVKDFIIYGPKKPELAEDELELAEYNIMADYAISPDNYSEGDISQGTLRKNALREMTYSGTWNIPALDPSLGGFRVASSTSSSYVEYTFFGTGFDLKMDLSTSSSVTLSLDGSSDFTSYTSQVYNSVSETWTPATGVYSLNSGPYTGLSISDIPLGVHTLRVTNTVAVQEIRLHFLDIHTPIHINDPSFKVGSLAMKDLRKSADIADSNKNKIDLSKAKAWLHYSGTNNKVLSSYNVSSVFNSNTGTYNVYWKQPFKDSNYVVVSANSFSTDPSTQVGTPLSSSRYMRPDSVEIRTQTSGGLASANSFYMCCFW